MDVRAILIVGGNAAEGSREAIGSIPLAYLDVLGMPVLDRVLRGLEQCGISQVTLVSESFSSEGYFTKHSSAWSLLPRVQASREQLWQAAEDAFQTHVNRGADLVLAVRVGPYVEINYQEMAQRHINKGSAITRAIDADGQSLELFLISAPAQGEAATLFGSRLQRVRKSWGTFPVRGYVNRLRTAADLRQLATDALLKTNAVCPIGKEIKPGVWVGRRARIHRHARIVAPAYIGAGAKIRAAALITRGSVVEQHADVDCGTVVENSTVLPDTYVGAGLDVMHSVIGFRRLYHLVRNVEVEISDGKLVGMSALRAVSRFAGSTAALFNVLRKRVFRGEFTIRKRESSVRDPESLGRPSAVLETSVEDQSSGSEVSKFPSSLAVARRYGEQ